MCDKNTMSVARFLSVLVLLSACGDHDSILNQIKQHNNGYSESETTEAADSSGSAGVEPGETSSTGDPATTDDENETQADTSSEFQLTANHKSLARAGSLLLEVETDLDLDSLSLFVTDDHGPLRKIEWPVGQRSLEYIVDHPGHNGVKEFSVIGQTGDAPVFASTAVVIDLPESGSVQYSWLGPADTSSKAVLIQTGPLGYADRVFVVGNEENHIAVVEMSLSGAAVDRALDDNDPLSVTSATFLTDGTLVLVGTSGEDSEVRAYREHGGRWVRFWRRSFEKTVFKGTAAVGDDIIVVGEATRGAGIDATAWQLTESGGTVFEDTLSLVDDEGDEAIDSTVTGVAVRGEEIVCAGFVLQKLDNHNFIKQPRLFSFESGVLSVVPRAETHDSENVSANFTGNKIAVWGRAGDETSFRAIHDPDLSVYSSFQIDGQIFSGLSNHAVGSLDGRPAVFRDGGWFYQHTDEGRFTATAVDRFGVVYAVGRVESGGHSQALVVALNP